MLALWACKLRLKEKEIFPSEKGCYGQPTSCWGRASNLVIHRARRFSVLKKLRSLRAVRS
jgi:hypothetical protein